MSNEVKVPPRLVSRPRDRHGRVVPFFVAYVNGEWDFRVVDPNRLHDCLRFKWCWQCGKPMGGNSVFVVGPMCTVNRVSAEPPSHMDCSLYSVQVCPFLTKPQMRRRDAPEGVPLEDPPGVFIQQNPGVTALWTSRSWKSFTADGGLLFDIGEPVDVAWWSQGRLATRAEVFEAFDQGLPRLKQEAAKGGDRSMFTLGQMFAEATKLVPAV